MVAYGAERAYCNIPCMRLAVPYGIRFGAEGRIEVFPVAYIRLKATGGTMFAPGIFVIDSGATTSLLPASDAKILGLDIKKGEEVVVRGATGHTVVGYRKRVDMKIDGLTLNSVPVIFVEGDEIPRVLGREAVFNHFGILFDEARRRTGFFDSKKERKLLDSLFEG